MEQHLRNVGIQTPPYRNICPFWALTPLSENGPQEKRIARCPCARHLITIPASRQMFQEFPFRHQAVAATCPASSNVILKAWWPSDTADSPLAVACRRPSDPLHFANGCMILTRKGKREWMLTLLVCFSVKVTFN